MQSTTSGLFTRIETEISNYLYNKIELSPGVSFSQHEIVSRIYKFANHDQSGDKINTDLSYNYWFDIISPRVDSETKNLRFDSKNIMIFSQNPRKDFAGVFVMNASLKQWLAENGEDLELKTAIERFTSNGNVGFKKIAGGYEFTDDLNTIVTNQKAETIDDTDLVERHEMTASQMKRMAEWDQEMVTYTIKELGNKFFSASPDSAAIAITGKRYEIFEFTGEVSEEEYNAVLGLGGGDPDTYFLAKVIVSGLQKNKQGEKYVLFAEKLTGKLSDYYMYAHRGQYKNRFWRKGMYEMLFDHQIRANEIGNGLARGLEWASKTIFRSKDSKVLQNIRADLDNGDVIITEDLAQVNVRMQGLDQLIADWNRLMNDADRLVNSYEVVRGESAPSGTPFRSLMLSDQNAGKLFTLLRQKITLPYKRVFREWVMPELVKGMRAKDIFRFTGETDILDELRKIIVESWYIDNLVAIGPHTKETADSIKEEKVQEMKKVDPTLKNSPDIWKGIFPRLLVTITGENSDVADQMQDLMALVQLESDPDRVAWILDTMYKTRGIPIPPKKEQPAPEMVNPNQPQPNPKGGQQPSPQQNNPMMVQ